MDFRDDLNHNLKPFSEDTTITDEGQTLPQKSAKWIMLSLWNASDKIGQNYKGSAGLDAAEPEIIGNEIYFGFGDQYAHQLFPGTDSKIFAIQNLSEVRLKARPNQKVKVFYTYWK